MASNVYKQDELGKAGYSMTSNSLTWNGNKDKLFLTIKSTNGDGRMSRVYVAPELTKGYDTKQESFPLPKDWVFIEISKPDEKFYILGVDKRNTNTARPPRPFTPAMAPEKLPCRVTDIIALKESPDEEYEVVYANRDVFLVTCKRICNLYLIGTIGSPTKLCFWDNFDHVVITADQLAELGKELTQSVES